MGRGTDKCDKVGKSSAGQLKRALRVSAGWGVGHSIREHFCKGSMTVAALKGPEGHHGRFLPEVCQRVAGPDLALGHVLPRL